jgi:hypothetical protein
MFRKMNSASYLSILRAVVILCFILFAAAVRVLPHPWNFTPIAAIALFSGANLAAPGSLSFSACRALLR